MLSDIVSVHFVSCDNQPSCRRDAPSNTLKWSAEMAFSLLHGKTAAFSHHHLVWPSLNWHCGPLIWQSHPHGDKLIEALMGCFVGLASACKQAATEVIWFENKSQFLPNETSQPMAALSPHVFLLTLKWKQGAPLLGMKHWNIQGPLHWPFCHGGPGQALHVAGRKMDERAGSDPDLQEMLLWF